MKRLLILRFPANTSPEKMKDSTETTQRVVGSEYVVLPFTTDVKKIEAEIIYDPNTHQGRTEFLPGEGSLSWRHNA
jgi:hypothetical protein